ncbi:MAG: hypothetical protein BWK79_00005 [Beggiatoa sp. IS2]|nr:MAG: hypothetical protein BWK79_00005 [Beggiatoa sp. IS2]
MTTAYLGQIFEFSAPIVGLFGKVIRKDNKCVRRVAENLNNGIMLIGWGFLMVQKLGSTVISSTVIKGNKT